MRSLILSLNSYKWVRNCAGLILQDPNRFDVIIVNKDNHRPIGRYKSLCKNAVYEQRKYDIYRIGKRLGLKKVSNLGYYGIKDSLSVQKLVTQLTLHITISGIKEIFCEDNYNLLQICKSICNERNLKLYIYGTDKPASLEIELSNEQFKTKQSLEYLLVGSNNRYETDMNMSVEGFYLGV